jgi:hypothetical protein
MGEPVHGNACNGDQHQKRYQTVPKPTAAGLGDVSHAGSIVAGLGGFKPERARTIMEHRFDHRTFCED